MKINYIDLSCNRIFAAKMIKKIKDIMSKKKKTDDSKKIEIEDQNEQMNAEMEDNIEDNANLEDQSGENDSEIDELKAQVAESKDKYLRLMAEFENYKKRAVRQRMEYMEMAAKDTLTAILPVLDDFDRAKKNAEDDSSEEPFSEGVLLVYNKLHNILSQKGLTVMESTGADFDPELHEALTQIPAPTEDMKGKVIDTIESGYLLKEKIIRHAKVVVGK